MKKNVGFKMVKATLDDQRRIALILPQDKADAFIEKLVANAGEAPREKAAPRANKNASPVKRPKLARIATMLERNAICSACPNVRKEGDWLICGLCDCPMTHQNMLANATCKDKENPRFWRELPETDTSLKSSA